MTAGYRIESVTLRSGAVYTIGYAPANGEHANLVESLQEGIDPTRKRKLVRAVLIGSDAPPTGA